jgi:hypothetical protein
VEEDGEHEEGVEEEGVQGSELVEGGAFERRELGGIVRSDSGRERSAEQQGKAVGEEETEGKDVVVDPRLRRRGVKG